jgi:hypothetical protein
MEHILWTSILITVVYISLSILDRLYIQKEPLNVKQVIKDAVMVYISGVVGIYGITYIKGHITEPPGLTVFTDAPNF